MPLSGHLAALLGITATVRERWDGLKISQQAAGDGEVMLYGPIVPGIEGAFISEFVGDDLVVSARTFRDALNKRQGRCYCSGKFPRWRRLGGKLDIPGAR